MWPFTTTFTEKRPNCKVHEHGLESLIKSAENETRLVDFREQLLAITQLYFDGLLSQKNPKYPVVLEQEKILDNLCLAGKKTIGAYYRGEEVDLDCLKEIFLPYASKIIEHGSKTNANVRHLDESQKDVYNFGLRLSFIFNKPFDVLACVASGGFEPSFLAMDIMEMDSLIPVRYSRRRNESEVKVLKKTSADYLRALEGKRILVIEDWVISGKSLANVMKYVAKMKPSELYGVSVKGGSFTPSFLCNQEIEEVNRIDPCVYKAVMEKDKIV